LSDARTDYANDNLFMGQNAGNAITTGRFNTVVGEDAGDALVDGNDNTLFGWAAGSALNNEGTTTAVGFRAGNSLDNGIHNTFLGANSGWLFNNGSTNTFIGEATGGSTGTANTAVGSGAGRNNSGSNNVFIGQNSADGNTSGNQSVTIGSLATLALQGNLRNVVIGYNSLNTATSGTVTDNIIIGTASVQSMTAGTDNILIANATNLPTATTNNFLNIGNTIFGDLANDRVRIGGTGAVGAFHEFEINGTMAARIPAGTTAQRPGTPQAGTIRINTSTNPNVFEYWSTAGTPAWQQLSGGGGGGTPAGTDTQVQFNDGGTAFGGDAGLLYDKTNDKLTVGKAVRIVAQAGNAPITSGISLTDGDKGDITVASTGTVWTIDTGALALDELSDVTTTGVAADDCLKYNNGATEWQDLACGSTFSDARLKDIRGDYGQGLDDILKLHTVVFNYKKDNPMKLDPSETHFGFVAQEVQKIFPGAVEEGDEGYLRLDPTIISVAMVNAIQDLKAENDALKTELASLKSQQDDLGKQVELLNKALNSNVKKAGFSDWLLPFILILPLGALALLLGRRNSVSD
jgi:hypothetical protein